MEVLEPDTGEVMGEVAYVRGLTNHPLLDKIEVHAIAEACRETGILMSPSDASSSDADKSEDGDDESSSSCHGFTTSNSTPSHYSEIEEDPMYAVLLHTIRKQQRLHELRLASTTDDFQDRDEDVPEGAAAAPHPAIHEDDVLHHAPTSPPHQSATSADSPLRFSLRSGRVKQGAPQKRGGGTRSRR